MFDESRFEELKKEYKFKVNQNDLYFSNKHFKILSDLVSNGSIKRSHLYFSFAYLYLTTYLFRYTKYSEVIPSTKDIKKTLTHSSIDKKVDYLIKRGGVLDSEGLTFHTTNFPLSHEFNESGTLVFTLLSDFNDITANYTSNWKKKMNINNNVGCKYNYLSFHDDINDDNEFVVNSKRGTFYNSKFTTNIPFEVFLYCMSNSEVGLRGFYMYSYISFMNNISGKYLNRGIVSLGEALYMSKSSTQKVIYALREYNMVNTIVADYIFNKFEKDYKFDSNAYHTNDFDMFVFNNNKLNIIKPTYINAFKQPDIHTDLIEGIL